MRRTKTALLLLIIGTLLLGGCTSVPTSQTIAEPTRTEAQPEPTATEASPATAAQAAPPTATQAAPPTATKVVPPTATASPTPTTEASSAQPSAGGTFEEGFTPQGEPFRGVLDAPIVMEEFSSYQCPFCGMYFQQSFSQIMANYVETGQVLYIFRDHPLPGQPQSVPAAEAANCAGELGGGAAYWDMHDRLFLGQGEWSGDERATDIFKGYAAALSLDDATFAECLDSGSTRPGIQADLAEASSRGVRGTPTFFIDGQPLVGAQPYEVFTRMLDAALASDTTSEYPFEMAPVSALPPEAQQLPQEVQEAYRFALANREILEKIPCYCGCGAFGHMNNWMCYIESISADGNVVFDNHAAG